MHPRQGPDELILSLRSCSAFGEVTWPKTNMGVFKKVKPTQEIFIEQ